MKKEKTMSRDAYREIKSRIVFCQFKPGEQIDIKDLTNKLGFNSITPVREALLLLCNEKLVDIVPRKGMFVSDISMDDVFDNYQLREIIEPTAFAVTALNVPEEIIQKYYAIFRNYGTEKGAFDLSKYLQIDMEFHIDLLKPIGNKNLHNILRDIYEQNARYRMACLKIRDLSMMINEHLLILDAVAGRDAEKAVACLKQHIYNSKMAFYGNKHTF